MGMSGNAWKYARPEFERRYLLSRVPAPRSSERRHIVDRYFAETQLRLRMVTSASVREYKLTQKVPDPTEGARGRLTTMYLTATAYSFLEVLPGSELHKTRLSIPPYSVDIFEGALEGLVLRRVRSFDRGRLGRVRAAERCGGRSDR